MSVLFFTRLDFVVRPKVIYALTDRWKVTVGAAIFRGPPQSFLGRLRDNSTAYAELRWSFLAPRPRGGAGCRCCTHRAAAPGY